MRSTSATMRSLSPRRSGWSIRARNRAPTARAAARRRGCPTADSSPHARHGGECAHRAGGAAVVWRSMLRAIVCSTSETTTRPSLSATSKAARSDCRCGRGKRDAVLGHGAPVASTCSRRENSGVSSGMNSATANRRRCARGRRRRTAQPSCTSPPASTTTTASDRRKSRTRRRELIAERIRSRMKAMLAACRSRAGRKNDASWARTLFGSVSRFTAARNSAEAAGPWNTSPNACGPCARPSPGRNATAWTRSARAPWRTARPATDRPAVRRS